jgi:hypothetical protein
MLLDWRLQSMRQVGRQRQVAGLRLLDLVGTPSWRTNLHADHGGKSLGEGGAGGTVECPLVLAASQTSTGSSRCLAVRFGVVEGQSSSRRGIGRKEEAEQHQQQALEHSVANLQRTHPLCAPSPAEECSAGSMMQMGTSVSRQSVLAHRWLVVFSRKTDAPRTDHQNVMAAARPRQAGLRLSRHRLRLGLPLPIVQERGPQRRRFYPSFPFLLTPADPAVSINCCPGRTHPDLKTAPAASTLCPNGHPLCSLRISLAWRKLATASTPRDTIVGSIPRSSQPATRANVVRHHHHNHHTSKGKLAATCGLGCIESIPYLAIHFTTSTKSPHGHLPIENLGLSDVFTIFAATL